MKRSEINAVVSEAARRFKKDGWTLPLMNERVGITAGGNWIVDRVKMTDCLPGRGMLANIRSEVPSTGGAPANVLADLARLGAQFPLDGAGVIGNDSDGKFLLDVFRKLGVGLSNMVITKDKPTSYTDVMTEQMTGDRTFFHCRGANAVFGPEHVPVKTLTCRVFHLGYILLLDRMDSPDRQYGTVASRLLAKLQAHGIKTSVDVVSEEGNRFRSIVPPALKHVDYLILNEIETGRIVGKKVRMNDGKLDGKILRKSVEDLFEIGGMELVAVHMPEGVYLRLRNGEEYSRGSLNLPKGFIKSSVGAGDAFCAGMLFGIHEGWHYARSAQLGTCCAAASLSESGATEGVGPLREVLRLAEKFPERKAPVTVK